MLGGGLLGVGLITGLGFILEYCLMSLPAGSGSPASSAPAPAPSGAPAPPATIRDAVLARADDPSVAILFEDQSWTYKEYVAQCCAVAQFLLSHREATPEPEPADPAEPSPAPPADPTEPAPFHVGVLLDNGPDFSVMLGAVALCGAILVGINPTRRGHELVRDITHTQCQIIITEKTHRDLLEPALAELAAAPGRSLPVPAVYEVDSSDWRDALAEQPTAAQPPDIQIDPAAPYLLLFTSGTTGDPKAAICSQRRMARIASVIVQTQQLTAEDVCYQCMPMFHSNALLAGWSPCLVAGATAAFRRRFSASGWLDDIRRYKATYFNYVGKPLTYILATPARPDDANNTLRRVFGNEGAPHDLERFSARFGVATQDSYGSTEGAFGISRTPDTPAGALGKGDEQTRIYDPETGQECPAAVFGPDGSLANADEAIGEIVHLRAAGDFEGYWNNAEADLERTHGGIYWSGDLGYRDADGMFYFAGRNYDWLRVDGENFAAAPVERILERFADIDVAAVYAVPNSDVGDDVMAAVIHRPGAEFDPQRFSEFLAAQGDLGTKWAPRYVRWARDMPKTETMKILKRVLRAERWECGDEVWVRDGGVRDGGVRDGGVRDGGGARDGGAADYRLLRDADVAAIRQQFSARGRAHLL